MAPARLAFTFSDPDYNFKSLRLNAVFRWEMKPGSNFYVVWTRQQQDFSDPGQFAPAATPARCSPPRATTSSVQGVLLARTVIHTSITGFGRPGVSFVTLHPSPRQLGESIGLFAPHRGRRS